ncbi:ankyrin repeat protein, partial [Ancylostoma duodenale]
MVYPSILIPYFSHSTALHVAAKNGYDDIVRLLLEKGATIDRRDENSHTALDLAVSGGHRSVARVLVEADDWKRIMTPRDKVLPGHHNEPRNTPFRKLLSKFPDVAKLVLDRCVENTMEVNRAFFGVLYDFSLIDDTYMMPSNDGKVLIGERSSCHDKGNLKKGARMYSEDCGFVYENHPLKLM